MTDPREKLNELAALLLRYKISHGTEAKMQAQVGRILASKGFTWGREVILTEKDRLDLGVFFDGLPGCNFMQKPDLGVIAIECKIAGTTYDLLSQISGYIQHPDVAAVLVVTSRQAHREMPEELHGKPVAVVWVGGNSL